jgi:hypothetical protein
MENSLQNKISDSQSLKQIQLHLTRVQQTCASIFPTHINKLLTGESQLKRVFGEKDQQKRR